MKKERRREEAPDPRPKEDGRLEFWRKDQQEEKKQKVRGKRRKPGMSGVGIPCTEAAVYCELWGNHWEPCLARMGEFTLWRGGNGYKSGHLQLGAALPAHHLMESGEGKF